MNKTASLLILFNFISCASIYTGKELFHTKKEEIKSVDKSVTFRFILVGRRETLGGVDEYSYRLKKESHNNVYKYIKNLNVFKEVKYFKPNNEEYGSRSFQSSEMFKRFYSFKFETDYLVDIYINYKKFNHGNGTGMLGGLLSYITLGLIPHYGIVNRDYIVNVLSKDIKKAKSLKFKEKYGVLSAIWLWPVPSSEPTHRKNKLSKRELDKAHYLTKQVIGIINNEKD